MAVQNVGIVPLNVFIKAILYRFMPAILASTHAVEASISPVFLLKRKSYFAAQSPTAKISVFFSVRIYSSTLIKPISLSSRPDFSAKAVFGLYPVDKITASTSIFSSLFNRTPAAFLSPKISLTPLPAFMLIPLDIRVSSARIASSSSKASNKT